MAVVGTALTGRNKVRTDLGKGGEMLRFETIRMGHSASSSITDVAIIGPFDVDFDVVKIVATAGLVPADNASNLTTVFNGTVAGAVTLATYNWHTVTPTAQVPVAMSLVAANSRLKAGSVLSIQTVFAGNDSAATANFTYLVEFELPWHDPSANCTTYSGYTDGDSD